MTENSNNGYADRSWMNQPVLPQAGYSNWASQPPPGPPPGPPPERLPPPAFTLEKPPTYRDPNNVNPDPDSPRRQTTTITTTRAWNAPAVRIVNNSNQGCRGRFRNFRKWYCIYFFIFILAIGGWQVIPRIVEAIKESNRWKPNHYDEDGLFESRELCKMDNSIITFSCDFTCHLTLRNDCDFGGYDSNLDYEIILNMAYKSNGTIVFEEISQFHTEPQHDTLRISWNDNNIVYKEEFLTGWKNDNDLDQIRNDYGGSESSEFKLKFESDSSVEFPGYVMKFRYEPFKDPQHAQTNTTLS